MKQIRIFQQDEAQVKKSNSVGKEQIEDKFNELISEVEFEEETDERRGISELAKLVVAHVQIPVGKDDN